MKKRRFVVATMVLVAAACSRPPDRATVAQDKSTSRTGAITLSMSTPTPPVTGPNSVTILVQDDGRPVNDAAVTGEFFMPVMESMGKTKVQFAPAGDGRYTGQGNLSMAGSWQVTVTAQRAGQTLATRTFNLTTKQ